MMRFLTIGFLSLSLLVVGTNIFPSYANAQALGAKGCTSAGPACSTTSGVQGQCKASVTGVGFYCDTDNSAVSGFRQQAQAPSSAGTGGENEDGDNATGYTGSTVGEMGLIMSTIMSWFAWLVGMAALVLDYCVYFTVLTMGTYINNLSAIGMTWSIIRDIGNIALIFGFLMVGINTILGTHWYGAGQKLIPALIMVAVGLNFSLFFAEAVIDTGNLFASQFYTQINGGTPASVRPFSDVFDLNATTEGISSVILGQLSLQRLYGDAIGKPEVFVEGTPMFVALMAIMLFMVTAFVMLSLAFTLVARFVILIFVIITSPIGLIGFAIPPLESKAKEWWSTLVNQTLTAPVMMLMLYVALRVITDVHFLTGFCTSPNAGDEGGCGGYLGWIGSEQADLASTGSMLLSFLVAMGLLLAVNMIAKSLSAWGAGGAMKLAGRLAIGAPLAVTGWGLRNTVGKGSYKLAKTIRSSEFGATATGRLLATGFDKGSKASYDGRAIKAFGGLKAAGIDAGKPQEGGYKGAVEKSTKAHEEYIQSVYKSIGDKKGKYKEEIEKNAKASLEEAEKEQVNAETQFRSLNDQITEYNRLKGLNEADAYWRTDPANLAALNNAEKAAQQAQRDVGAAKSRVDTANENLKNAQNAVENADKAAAAEVAAKKKAAGERYAESIDGIVPGLIFGVGTRAAAEKIKNNAGKDEDKTKKALKELFESVEKEKEKEHAKHDDNSAETAAPAPKGGSAPSAPASSGGDHHH